MDENLVGYLLNSLDPETHRQVEEYLDASAPARRRLEHLRRALEPLAADGEPARPPSGLWVRTLAHIAEDRCRRLPAAPRPTTVTAGASRAWWRRADLLVAASVLVLLGGIGMAWVIEQRHNQQVAACANNLKDYHQALVNYSHANNDNFPQVEAQGPRSVAGVFVPVLNDAKLLKNVANMTCPGNGDRPPPARTLEELAALHQNNPAEFRKVAGELSKCYAYSLGYQEPDENGKPRHRGLGIRSGDEVPIMSDRPPFELGDVRGRPGNSKNHGGRGQNVLHVGGHVSFLKARSIGPDDIYLNSDQRVAVGSGPNDAVLGASWASPYPRDD